MTPHQQSDAGERFVSSRRQIWNEREKTITLGGKPVLLLVPDRGDPRLVEIVALLVATIFRIFVIHQALTSAQILVALLVSISMDIPLTYARRAVLVTPASSAITGLITALVLQTSAIWPFAVAAALAILSKHLLRASDRHIFNPSAVGLAVVLLAFPHLVHAGTEAWQTSALLSPIVGVGGLIATKKAHLLTVINWFMPTYALLLIAFAVAPHGMDAILHRPHATFSGAEDALFAARYSFMIFAFYLLTEPRTAPQSQKGRRVYAVLTGVFGIALHLIGLDRVAALFLGLLISNALVLIYLDKRFPQEVGTQAADAELPTPARIIMFALGPFLRRRAPPTPATEAPVVAAPSGGQPFLPEGVPRASGQLNPVPDGSFDRHIALEKDSLLTSTPPMGAADQTIAMPKLTPATAEMYLLISGDSPLRFALTKAETTVGRATSNDICLVAAGVSRHHALLTRQDLRLMLTDLGSLNGTLLNEQPVHGTVEVRDGDRVHFGGAGVGVDADIHISDRERRQTQHRA